MSVVDTTTRLPAGTPVMEIDAATARDIAKGNCSVCGAAVAIGRPDR